MSVKAETVWGAARNANGSSDFYKAVVEVSQEQFDNGEHYDLAEEAADDAGYEGPFVCFDSMETAAIVATASAIAHDCTTR